MKRNSDFASIYLPSSWVGGEYPNITVYFIQGIPELQGYRLSMSNAMISRNISFASTGLTMDKLVYRKTQNFTFKRNGTTKTMLAAEFAEMVHKLDFSVIKESASDSTETRQKNAVQEEPVPELPEEYRAVICGTWEEDIAPVFDDIQVLKASNADLYIVCADADINSSEDDDGLVLTQQKRDEIARRLAAGKTVLFSDLFTATSIMVGGESELFDMLSPEAKQEVIARYTKKLASVDCDYWDTLPALVEVVNDYQRELNWAKYQSYKNDRAYEKNTPFALRDKKLFVGWKFVYYNDEGKPLPKPAKVPFSPHADKRAQSNNRNTWGTFEEACAAVDKYGYDGIGIMFGSGVCGVDIDGCVKDGVISAAARDIVSRLDSYTEFSPSGTGVHVLCFGEMPRGARNDEIGLEMYSSGRFFTLTGHRFELQMKMRKKDETQPVLDALFEEHFSAPVGRTAIISPVEMPTEEKYPSTEIVKRIMKSKKMGGKFERLCQGLPPFKWDAKGERWTSEVDTSFLKVTGEPDTSKLDFAFCQMLVFYRATATQIDEIYRAQEKGCPVDGLTVAGGGLARDKWYRKQSGATYGQIVINNAFHSTSATAESQGFVKKNSNQSVHQNVSE